MGREDQEQEREVLQSIFPDELTEISDTELRISILLDVPGEKGPQPTVLLNVRYPDDYPDRPPHLDILAAPNAPLHPRFSVAADRDALLEQLATTAEENVGEQMVYTLVMTLKEAAEALIEERRAETERVREEVAREAEREENRKFQGQLVTPEAFLKWRAGFLAEMAEKKAREEEERAAEMKKAKIKDPTKLTGRQLWERGLAGRGDEDEDDGEDAGEAPVEGIAKLQVAN
jgi:hypothetical protein